MFGHNADHGPTTGPLQSRLTDVSFDIFSTTPTTAKRLPSELAASAHSPSLYRRTAGQFVGILNFEFLRVPIVYDLHLANRFAYLGIARKGMPDGSWLHGPDRELSGAAGAYAPLDLVATRIWRGPNGERIGFVADQRVITEELIFALESRGQYRLSARWWGTFLTGSTVMLNIYRQGHFTNADYHHIPSLYRGSWFAQPYIGGESHLVHSNWGRLRDLPGTWDIAGFIKRHLVNADRQHAENGGERVLFETFANAGVGWDFVPRLQRLPLINATKPVLLGGLVGKAVFGASRQWNFHVSAYEKVAGGAEFSLRTTATWAGSIRWPSVAGPTPARARPGSPIIGSGLRSRLMPRSAAAPTR